MPKALSAVCLLLLLVSAGCSCLLSDSTTLLYDPFDKRTADEKWDDDRVEAEANARAEDYNEARQEQLSRPSAL
jgi:hypothetical protein